MCPASDQCTTHTDVANLANTSRRRRDAKMASHAHTAIFVSGTAGVMARAKGTSLQSSASAQLERFTCAACWFALLLACSGHGRTNFIAVATPQAACCDPWI